MSERHAVWQLLDKLQMDNRAQAAKLVELRAYMAQLAIPEPSRLKCEHCGATHRGRNTLAEHVYQCHAGPVPEHYLAAERAAGFLT